MQQLTTPPGFPDDDDDTPDGGGPPSRADALAAIDRIQAHNAALANARIAAQNWADWAQKPTYVIENGIHIFPADDADRAEYHQADINAGRACVVWQLDPTPAAITVPDVAFAPVGWAD